MTSWPPPTVPEVDLDEVARGRDQGVPLIDVRQPEEYDAAHVPGARLIPLSEVGLRVTEVPTGGPVHIICLTGARSEKAVQFLRQRGIDAYSVVGGTKAWVESGHPTVSGPTPG
ncbi:MAG TPA: rhodanese-like domain-containing protein [Acidimicrobiales bacterium]|nr:rhodanese-like domain-containing protein [Acidimicrobiales bacterium]